MTRDTHGSGGVRVLALLSDGPGAPGGIARYNTSLLHALAMDDRIGMVTALMRNGEPDTSPGTKRLRFERRSSRAGFASAALHRALGGGFDLVLCGHLNYAPLASLAARMCGARVWYLAFGIDAWRAPGAVTRHAVNAGHRIIAISRFTRRKVNEWAQIAPHRLRVLPPTFDGAFSRRPQRTRGNAGPRLLSVSRLDARERYKGQDAVIRCLPTLGQRHPKVCFQIVGEGDDWARLEALARATGVHDQVQFLGAVDHERLREIYRDADVFVMPSRGEGFGIVYLEALASGLPVVAGNGDGAADALRDGLLGELVDPDDPHDIVRGIEAALERAPATPADLACFAAPAFDARMARLIDELWCPA